MTTKMEVELLDACPVCESEDIQKFFTDVPSSDRPVTEWQLCNTCFLVFQNPRPTEKWMTTYYADSEYRQSVEGKEDEEPDPAKHVAEESFRSIRQVSFLSRMVGSVKRHLDVGSSTGTMMATMQDRFQCASIGIEPDIMFRDFVEQNVKDFVEEVKKRGIADPMTFTSVPHIKDISKEPKFDLITASHVLEHVHHPLKLLKRLRGKLTAKGAILVEVPTLFGGHVSPMLFPHLYAWNQRTLRDLMTRAGFYEWTMETWGNLPNTYPGPLFLMGLWTKDENREFSKAGFLDRINKHRQNVNAITAAIQDRQKYDVG
jgi:SAM-dependent methyltransferase